MTRILVVEDDETIAAAIAERLRSEGFVISLASNGQAGLDLDLRERPDLVLLDLMLPGIDGFEVCRRLRARRDVPVIMLTARDDETDVLVGLAVGADDTPKRSHARARCSIALFATGDRRRGTQLILSRLARIDSSPQVRPAGVRSHDPDGVRPPHLARRSRGAVLTREPCSARYGLPDDRACARDSHIRALRATRRFDRAHVPAWARLREH